MQGMRCLGVAALVLLFGTGCEKKEKAESAKRTPYDDETSGVQADNVQEALDALSTQIATLQTELNAAETALVAAQAELDALGNLTLVTEINAGTYPLEAGRSLR